MVGIRAKDFSVFADGRIYNGAAWIPSSVVDYLIPFSCHALMEDLPAMPVFKIEIGKIGGKAFTEPHVVPIGLGGRIAKPLVRNLMCDQGLPFSESIY